MLNHGAITVTSLSGLRLAEYILKRLAEDGGTVEKLTQDLDGKENYVSSLVSVLEDIGWIKLEPSGKYIITDKGETEARKVLTQ